MYVVRARNVNDAFTQGMNLLHAGGVWQNSRAGEVLVLPEPLTTRYELPMERVLFHKQRDANPVFHLMESLWLLAGRNDARWLDQFVGDFSKRFAEEDGYLHGSYGFRWRKHFDMDAGGFNEGPFDQLSVVVSLLKKNLEDRRIVLTMWDPVADLGADKKDVPCNVCVFFRVRQEPNNSMGEVVSTFRSVLDMTVCCRSNDAVWGLFGSNHVQFSVLLEYMAARIGVAVGTYFHVSNNFHIYRSVLEKLSPLKSYVDSYAYPDGVGPIQVTPIVTRPEDFDADLTLFFSPDWLNRGLYKNPFFAEVAVPLREFYRQWRQKDTEQALLTAQQLPAKSDWRLAVLDWAKRRRMFKEEIAR